MPVAVIIAGILIAGAVFLRGGSSPVLPPVQQPTQAGNKPLPSPEVILLRAIDASDHIRGNPDAKVVFVEFSDTECPFCKRFHNTMVQLMSEYGKTGNVAWIYRHYPIPELHSKAPKEAEALECAGELGGNGKFWEYTDRIFAVTNSNDSLDPARLPQAATEVGLDVTKFNTCLASGKYAARVQADKDDGTAAGVDGTPHSVLVLKQPISTEQKTALTALLESYRGQTGMLPITFSTDGLRVGLNGAMPYQIVKQTVDALLK